MFRDCPVRQNKLQCAVHCICDVDMLDRVQCVTYLYLTKAIFQQDQVPSVLPLYGALNIKVHLSMHLCLFVCRIHRIATHLLSDTRNFAAKWPRKCLSVCIHMCST